MANMLKVGTEWLSRKLKQFAGEQVVYSRGAQSATLTATMGKTMMRLERPGGGSVIEWTDADFGIDAADLVLGGVATEPQSGDRIRWTSEGVTRVFEVLPYDEEPCWRWSDEHQTRYRVHTKQVGTE